MKCAYCKYNDGAVYTSIPPKYRCTITNEFHLALDDCNVEFAPVKHGRWIEGSKGWRYYYCSECGRQIPQMSKQDLDEFHKWCGRCGARMDEKE